MKRFILTLTLSASLGMAAGQAMAENVRLKMGATFPSKLTQLGTLGKHLEETVTEISGGDLQLKYFEPGALVV